MKNLTPRSKVPGWKNGKLLTLMSTLTHMTAQRGSDVLNLAIFFIFENWSSVMINMCRHVSNSIFKYNTLQLTTAAPVYHSAIKKKPLKRRIFLFSGIRSLKNATCSSNKNQSWVLISVFYKWFYFIKWLCLH